MYGRPVCAMFVLVVALVVAGSLTPARADEGAPTAPPTAPPAAPPPLPPLPAPGEAPAAPPFEPAVAAPVVPWQPATAPAAPPQRAYASYPRQVPCYEAVVVPGPVPCRRPTFELTLEGSVSILEDLDGPFGLVGPAQINWGGFNYGPLWGGGLHLTFALSSKSRLHFRGSYLGQIDAETRSGGGFAFAPPVPGIATTNVAKLRGEAEAMTGEFSYLRELCGSRSVRFDVGLGLRATSFKEQGRADEFATAFDPAFAGTPFVDSKSTNTFLGGQIVAAMHWDVAKCFEVYAAFKPALGMMTRKVRVQDTSIFSSGGHDSTTKREDFAFDFELEASVRWKLSQCVFLTGGYRMLFLDQVVRANDAMDFSRATSGAVQPQHKTDEVFLHTFFVGFGVAF